MGACGSGEKMSAEEAKQRKLEKDRSKNLDAQTKKQEQEDKKIKKLLLLGAGESGKSTLFKQMITLYGKGFTMEDKKGYIPIIYNNTITAIKTLVKQSDLLDDESCRIKPEHAEAKQFVNDLKVSQISLHRVPFFSIFPICNSTAAIAVPLSHWLLLSSIEQGHCPSFLISKSGSLCFISPLFLF